MKIVTCNGCFDGLHHGHLFFLGFCRGQGDSLVVGINSDRYMREVKHQEPMFNQDIRKKVLEDTGIPTRVVIFEEENPIAFIKGILPEIHCTGAEYAERCIEAEVCKGLGIELRFVPRIGKWSSTEMRKNGYSTHGS